LGEIIGGTLMTMSFGSRIAALSSVLLLASFGTLTVFTLSDLRDGMRQQQAAALRTVSLTLRSTLDRNGNTALAMAQMMALQPGNVTAVANGDREALIERMKAVYDYLHKQNGVEILQFQTADLKMLLRLSEPARFGDDVSQSRPMVVSANHNRLGQNGLEMGRTGILSLRGVAPMMQGSTLVGTAEVGFGLPGLVRAVKTRTGAEIAIVLSVAMTGGVQQDRKAYGDLVIGDSTDNALFARLLTAAGPRLAREDAFTETTIDGSTWGLVITPLLDFSGRMIGGFIGAQDFSALHAGYQRQVWRLLFISLGGLVLCYSVLVVAMRAFVFRPLTVLGDWLEAKAGSREPATGEPGGGAAEVDRIVKAATALVARTAPSPAAAKEPEK
jgi:methyl-accepting chemotaxis protein